MGLFRVFSLALIVAAVAAADVDVGEGTDAAAWEQLPPSGPASSTTGSVVALCGLLSATSSPSDGAADAAAEGAVGTFQRGATGWEHTQTLGASDGLFGASLACSFDATAGALLAVGAPNAQAQAGGEAQGALHVYVAAGGCGAALSSPRCVWQPAQRLTPPADAPHGAAFGWSAAASFVGGGGGGSHTLAAGAPFGGTDGGGAVFVYTAARVQVLGLPAGADDDSRASARFGWALALAAEGDTLLAGAPGAAGGVGRVAVFKRQPAADAAWLLDQLLSPTPGGSDSVHPLEFGWAIAAAAMAVVVGAPGSTVRGCEGVGAAVVYVRRGWGEEGGYLEARVTAVAREGGGDSARLGAAVAVADNIALIGSAARSAAAPWGGRRSNVPDALSELAAPTPGVIVFTRDFAAAPDGDDFFSPWRLAVRLVTPRHALGAVPAVARANASDGAFGAALAVDGAIAIVGAPRTHSADAGGASRAGAAFALSLDWAIVRAMGGELPLLNEGGAGDGLIARDGEGDSVGTPAPAHAPLFFALCAPAYLAPTRRHPSACD